MFTFNIRFLKKFALFFIVLIFAFIVFQTIKAQQQRGIILSPPSISESLSPGQKLTKIFTVVNQLGRDDNFQLITRDASFDDLGNPIEADLSDADLRSEFEENGWLTIAPTEFFLGNGKTQQFTVTLELPDDLPTKGYYFEIIVSTIAPDEKSTVGVVTEIALPFSLNYLGSERETRELDIFYFTAREKYVNITNRDVDIQNGLYFADGSINFQVNQDFFEYTPINLLTVLSNNGNVNVVPGGQIFIARDQEMKDIVAKLDFNPERRTVFQASGRQFTNTWDGGFLQIDENNRLVVDFSDINDIRIGQYYAQLNIIWDGIMGKDFETKVISFWIIPWKLIVAILAVIVILIVLMLKIKRRRVV